MNQSPGGAKLDALEHELSIMEKEGKKIAGDSAVEGDYMAPQIPILNDTQETNEAPGTGVNQLHY